MSDIKVEEKKTIEDATEKTIIDLRTEKKMSENKTIKKYDLIDEEIKVFKLDNDLVVKLISNNKGVFVDFRKYYKGYPTKKGIRLIASKFLEISKIMEPDIIQIVPNSLKYDN